MWHSDLIEHPCVICQRPRRSCGHTPDDVKRFFAEIREARLRARGPVLGQFMGMHRVPVSGSTVFRPSDATQGLMQVKAGDTWLKMRSTAPEHPVRDLTDEYGR